MGKESLLDKLEEYLYDAKLGDSIPFWVHCLVETLNDLTGGLYSGVDKTPESAKAILTEARKIYK